jgi:hypothetical protein
MDDTGMTDADKAGLVEDVLVTWGEDAAREIAERYGVDLRIPDGASAVDGPIVRPAAVATMTGRPRPELKRPH